MKIKIGTEYAFSFDNETFRTDVDYILDNLDNQKTVFVGEQVKKTHKDFLGVDSLIEKMQDNASVESEYSDGYLEDYKEEHEKNLEKLILDYLNEHLAQPNFYEAVNIQEISIEEFKKLFC